MVNKRMWLVFEFLNGNLQDEIESSNGGLPFDVVMVRTHSTISTTTHTHIQLSNPSDT